MDRFFKKTERVCPYVIYTVDPDLIGKLKKTGGGGVLPWMNAAVAAPAMGSCAGGGRGHSGEGRSPAGEGPVEEGRALLGGGEGVPRGAMRGSS